MNLNLDLPALTPMQKKWARRLGYPLFGLVTFVMALHYTFPYRQLEARVEDALAPFYDVTSLEIDAGWIPGHVIVRNLGLKNRPERESDKPIEFMVDEIDLNIGFLGALFGEMDLGIEAKLGDGEIDGHITASSDEVSFEFETEDLPLLTVPGIKSATGGVPIEGPLDAHIELTLPKGKWKQANGSLEFSCEGCTIGDGKAKIRPQARRQSNVFAEEGITLPKLQLGKIVGKIEIKKGMGTIDRFETKSPDGELSVEGDIRFDDPVERSQVTAYMMFKSSEGLHKREPRMADMEMMMGMASKRDDGYMGVRITGPMSGLTFVPSKTSPIPGRGVRAGANGEGGTRGNRFDRPSTNRAPTPFTPPPATPPTTPVTPPPVTTPPVETPPPGAETPPVTTGTPPAAEVPPPAPAPAAEVPPPPPPPTGASPDAQPPHDTDPDQPRQPPATID
jgi:type II secretion system protein N